METKRIPLPSVLATRDPSLEKDGLLTNCYYEHGPDAERIVKRPGTTLAANLGGDCPGQGAYYFAGGPVFIVCDELHVGLPASACVVLPPPDPRYLYLGDTESFVGSVAPTTCLASFTRWVWTVKPNLTNGGGTVLSVTVTSDVGEQVIATFDEAAVYDSTGVITYSVCEVSAENEIWVLCKAWVTFNRHALIARFSGGTAAIDGTASVAPAFIGFDFINTGPIDPQCMGYDPTTMKVWIEYAQSNVSTATIAIIEPSDLSVDTSFSLGTSIGYGIQFVFGYPYVGLVTASGPLSSPAFLTFNANTYALLYTVANSAISTALGGKVADYDSVRQRFVVLPQSGLTYTFIDAATGTLSYGTLSWATGHDTVPAPSTALLINAVAYYARLDLYLFGQNSSGSYGSTLSIVRPDTLEVSYTYTYEVGTNLLLNTFFEPATENNTVDDNYVLSFDYTHVKRLYFGVPC